MTEPPKKRNKARVIFRAGFVFVLIFGAILGTAAVFHPDTPLPDGWNPTMPLNVADQVTPLTTWKLRRAVSDREQCLSALGRAAVATPLTITETRDPNCQVRVPVRLKDVGMAAISVRETDCATALRLAMWEHHGLQPAAGAYLGTGITEIVDNGSYNCRRMRTSAGGSTRWSTHATARAIDVSGFRTADGRNIRLIRDWDGQDATARFLRDIRDASCKWFATTLSPEYNALHADHFHLQSTGWGTCR